MAKEYNGRSSDEGLFSVSIDASNVESELEGYSRNTDQKKALPESLHQINNGYALVIHNRSFTRLRHREGSEKDLDAIKIFCKEAGLYLDITENVKVNEIRDHCRRLTQDETKFRNYDGFVCFILSHGNSSGICGVDNETIRVEEIVSYFKECKDLVGKPKLFFIQACRDDDEDDGTDCIDGVNQNKRLCLPNASDILVAHSTIKGESSFRDIRKGSWFIQCLMKQFNKHARSAHVMDIMVMVNEDMAESDPVEGFRQMPEQVSTLTKFVYFKMAAVAKIMQAKNAILVAILTKFRSIFQNENDDTESFWCTVIPSRLKLLVDDNDDGETADRTAIPKRFQSVYCSNDDLKSSCTAILTTPRSILFYNDDSESRSTVIHENHEQSLLLCY